MKRTGSAVLAIVCFLACANSRIFAQSTYTAASCNYSDVNAVINGPTHVAVNGDTINVPAGSCTWTSELVISVGISLIGEGTPNTLPSQFGAGTLNTTILDGYTNTNQSMIAATVPNGQTLRISSFVINPSSTTTNYYSPIGVYGVCNAGGCPNLRADNLEFENWNPNGSNNGNQASWLIRTDGVYGVVDHNTLASSASGSLLANVHHSAWLGVGSNGDNSWAQPDSYGTASALYFENNVMPSGMLDCDEGPEFISGASQGGCRVAVRFNQFNSSTQNYSMMYTHGTESTGRTRGTRQVELYANDATYAYSGTNQSTATVGMRSGVLLLWGNTYTNSTGSGTSNWAQFNDYRTFAGYGTDFGPWGYCDGSGSWDSNAGTVYYSGTFTGSTGATELTDSAETWTSTFGSSSWAANAAAAGTPYSVRNITQSWGGEIDSSSGNSTRWTTISSIENTPQCNWLNHTACTWTNGDRYQILRSNACIDQPSRGANSGTIYLSGASPSPKEWVQETLDPSYEFDDAISGGMNNMVVTSTYKLLANRDFYQESKNQSAQTSSTSPFNGQSGTGHGTLANRPANCTSGVAYWATDQGNWNTSTNSYAGGFTQGEMYICTATNTWTLSYTPYTYPHPLTSGTTSPDPPNPPTGLQAVVQ